MVAGTGTLANVASTALVFTTGTLSLSGNLTTTGAYNPTFAIGASVTYTFPGSTATLASLDIAGQTVTGGVHVTSNNLGTVTSGTTSLDDGTRPTQYMTNGGASTLAADTTHDGSTAIEVTNNGSAGAVTVSGVSGSCVGATPDTTNGHKFMYVFTTVNAHAYCSIIAGQ